MKQTGWSHDLESSTNKLARWKVKIVEKWQSSSLLLLLAISSQITAYSVGYEVKYNNNRTTVKCLFIVFIMWKFIGAVECTVGLLHYNYTSQLQHHMNLIAKQQY